MGRMNDSLVDQGGGLTITIRESLGGLRAVWAQEERKGSETKTEGKEVNRGRALFIIKYI